MKLKHTLTIIFLSAFASCALASSLHESREQVIAQYLNDLQTTDYKHIVTLFEPNGSVMSTSRGKMDAKEFFYGFLQNAASVNAELHKSFASIDDTDRLGARFHLSEVMKNGEAGEGEYIDEFVFTPNSAKLSAVYMFENVKFTAEK